MNDAPRYQAAKVRVSLVKEASGTYRGKKLILRPEDVYNAVADVLGTETKEVFCVLHMDVRRRLLSVCHAGEGVLSACLVHPREVFCGAILSCAASIVVVHNHPSGDPSPSPQDMDLYKRLLLAGEILGIPVEDFVIIGHHGKFESLREGTSDGVP